MGVTVAVEVGLGVTVAVLVGVGVTVRVIVGVGVEVGVAVAVGKGVGVEVGVTVEVGVDVRVNVGVGVLVGVAVAVGKGVGVDVDVRVNVGVGVLVGVAVLVGKGVGVDVDVRVNVGVGVLVGVRVDVGVWLGVTVGVAVGVRVGVEVRVGVRVGVGVGVGDRTANVAVAATCCLIAEIVTLDVGAVIGVVIAKEAIVEPAGTVTNAGTVAAAGFELTRYTASPPAGAAASMVTVPVETPPPTTVVGLRLRLFGLRAVAVRTPVVVTPVEAAVTTVSTSFETTAVVATNVTVLVPAATVTDTGTDTTEEDVVSETAVLPAGAGPLSVRVPVADPPPATEPGLKVTLSGTGVEVSESAALFVAPPYIAEIVTEEPVPVVSVVTVNVPELDPAGMMMLAGTVALVVLELVSVTVAPPPSAEPFNMTVAVGLCPRETLVRLRVTEKGWRAGATVWVAAFDVPPDAAVMLTFVLVATEKVEIANVADVEPAETVTLAGTFATAVFELVSVTTVPPAGAAPFRVTVPVEVAEPKTVDGASVTE